MKNALRILLIFAMAVCASAQTRTVSVNQGTNVLVSPSASAFKSANSILGTTDIDTSAELKAIIGDENGASSGKLIFAEGTLTIASGITLTVSNSVTIAGTNGSTINIGAGGTLGTAAFATTSTGGNDTADSGKVATYNGTGGLTGTFLLAIKGSGGLGPGQLALYNTGNTFNTAITPGAIAANTTITLPTFSGTMATLAGTETLTNKSISGEQITSGTVANERLPATVANTGNPLSQFAATTSAQLRGVLSDENGTGDALFDGASTPSFTSPIIDGTVTDTSNLLVTAEVDTLSEWDAITQIPVEIGVALSDETTDITTGTAKVTFRAPYAFTVVTVRANVNTVSSSGLPTVDINESGTTILSTKLTIDASEKTSTTAATAAVISDASIADDAEITLDIDVAGTGAKGLKVWILGYR